MQLTTNDPAMTEALRQMLRDAWRDGHEAGTDPMRHPIQRNPYGRKGRLGRNPGRLMAWLLKRAESCNLR